MIPEHTKIHNKFRLNGRHFDYEDLSRVAYGYIKEGDPFEKVIGNFLLDWVDEKDYIVVKTSGSTGRPKTIKIQKQAMVHSAIASGDSFKLAPGITALHCLPTEFIAGKMMFVRAMILGLELDVIEPTSNPLQSTQKRYDFCAMVPLQAENSIDKINQIKTLIIGGASVSGKLRKKLKGKRTKIYETYGMTETLTHIAVKRLNNASVQGGTTWQSHKLTFHVLPNIKISQDKRDCLVIEAPHLFEGKVVTNDIVALHSDSEFEFLGRIDNVINSGGVKIFPEQIEEKLSLLIENRFFITSVADKTLGEKIVLIVEGDDDTDQLKNKIKGLGTLTKFETPKEIYSFPEFIEATSGKIQRQKTKKLLK